MILSYPYFIIHHCSAPYRADKPQAGYHLKKTLTKMRNQKVAPTGIRYHSVQEAAGKQTNDLMVFQKEGKLKCQLLMPLWFIFWNVHKQVRYSMDGRFYPHPLRTIVLNKSKEQLRRYRQPGELNMCTSISFLLNFSCRLRRGLFLAINYESSSR